MFHHLGNYMIFLFGEFHHNLKSILTIETLWCLKNCFTSTKKWLPQTDYMILHFFIIHLCSFFLKSFISLMQNAFLTNIFVYNLLGRDDGKILEEIKIKIYENGSSCCGSVGQEPDWDPWGCGFNPCLTQWVKDPVLLQAVV